MQPHQPVRGASSCDRSATLLVSTTPPLSSSAFTRYDICMDIFRLLVSFVHRVPKKTKQICFCQNFVKFLPISIIFGRKMRNDPNICEAHSFSTSPNLRHHLTVLNANVPNCYITPKLLVIDRSHWRPHFIRRRRTFRDHSNFRQFVHI